MTIDKLLKKRCSKCGKKYPPTEEFFHKTKLNGYIYLHAKCKKCRNEEKRVWNKKNKKKIKEYSEKYYKKKKKNKK